MKSILIGVFLALLAMLIFTVPVQSFTLAEMVVVGDDVLMVARVPAGGLSPAQRVARIHERLTEIIAGENLIPSNVHVANIRGETVIVVGDTVLLTVTTADAQANGTTVQGLADRWYKNTCSALPQARPPCWGERCLP